MIYANLWCRRMLRVRGLAHTLLAIPRISVGATQWQDAGSALLPTLRAYMTLRRVRAQGKRDCLHRSLALATALRRQRIAAEICFGVTKFPFLAHVWVQVDDTVVNESLTPLEKFSIIAQF